MIPGSWNAGPGTRPPVVLRIALQRDVSNWPLCINGAIMWPLGFQPRRPHADLTVAHGPLSFKLASIPWGVFFFLLFFFFYLANRDPAECCTTSQRKRLVLRRRYVSAAALAGSELPSFP